VPPLAPQAAPVLVDVTPRALVVETVGGWCDVIVQRNAKIPCDRTRAFTTSSDGQTVVRVRVAQGEDPSFGRNTFLGQVELVGLRAAPRGEVTIQVRFEVDESGSLNVYATDVATGREAHALLQLVGIAGAQSVEALQTKHAALRVG
jgi:molecular chaperone DnaK